MVLANVFGFLAISFPNNNLISTWYSGPTSFELDMKPNAMDSLSVMISLGKPQDGGPPQTLRALVDTATLNLWVVSKQNRISSKGFNPYDGDKSGKYLRQSRLISEPFSVGKMEGSVAQDVLQLGSGDKSLILEQEFAEATSVSPANFVFYYYDAILGLDLISPELLGENPQPTLISISKKYGKTPVFGLYISRSFRTSSKLVFGSDDQGFYEGEFTTHPVIKKNGFYKGWNIKITKFEVQTIGQVEKSFPVPSETFGQMVSRSPSLFVGPQNIMGNLNKEIFGRLYSVDASLPRGQPSKVFKFPCQNQYQLYMDLPDVTVYIDDKKYTFLPQDYIVYSRNECRSMFMSADIPNFIIGSHFMTLFYTRFDYENKAVHIAKARQLWKEVYYNKLTPEQRAETLQRLN